MFRFLDQQVMSAGRMIYLAAAAGARPWLAAGTKEAKWERPTKKEPPELAARSAKQGGVKVQKMGGHPH